MGSVIIEDGEGVCFEKQLGMGRHVLSKLEGGYVKVLEWFLGFVKTNNPSF